MKHVGDSFPLKQGRKFFLWRGGENPRYSGIGPGRWAFLLEGEEKLQSNKRRGGHFFFI